MQQRRPLSSMAGAKEAQGIGVNAYARQQQMMERVDTKKLRRIRTNFRSTSNALKVQVSDPTFQLAFSGFTILMLTGVTIFKTAILSSFGGDGPLSRDAFGAFQQEHMLELSSDADIARRKRGRLLNSLRSGPKYKIPESMRDVGDKSQWYSELRMKYDTKILPKNDARSLDFVEQLRNHQGNYVQSPKATTPYDIHNCPEYPPEGYPMQWPVLEVLDNWGPDDATPHMEIYQGFCVFDYRTELQKANNYRKSELPFIVRNDPNAARTAERWNHPGYLNELLMGDEDTMRRTEYSPTNHFMYWVDKRPREEKKRAAKLLKQSKQDGNNVHDGFGRGDQDVLAKAKNDIEHLNELKELYEEAEYYADEHPGDDEAQDERRKLKHKLKEEEERVKSHKLDNWKPPTENLRMTYLDWLSHANVTDDKLGPDDPHWYFRLIGCGTMGDGDCDRGSSEWLFDEMPYFQPRTGEDKPFYLVSPKRQQGIHCRFGMKGVIAENHFDLSRNAISLLGGQRRYILAHPNQCNELNLLPRGHPSARHSAVDWSDPDLDKFPTFADAQVNEVVMQPGDVMYLPTNWFHYIISLELNVQCNTRSGGEKLYREEINDCGF